MHTFQQALENRVKQGNKKKLNLDKHTVLKTTQDVIREIFGSTGLVNIKIINWASNKLILSSVKSTWRSEILFQKKEIRERINKKLGQEAVLDIFIREK